MMKVSINGIFRLMPAIIFLLLNIGNSVVASHYLVAKKDETLFSMRSPFDQSVLAVSIKSDENYELSEVWVRHRGTRHEVPKDFFKGLPNIDIDSFQLRFDPDKKEYLFLYFEYGENSCDEEQCRAVEFVFDGVKLEKRSIE